jgi:hypothetical protein
MKHPPIHFCQEPLMRIPKIMLPLVLVAMVSGLSSTAPAADWYNKKGNILIADQFNNRVLEIDPATHDIVWSFGDGSSKAARPRSSRPMIFNASTATILSPALAHPREASRPAPMAAPTTASC